MSLPQIFRLKEMRNALPSNFDVSDISIMVYDLNPPNLSNLFHYKQFALHLNIDEFLKDPNLIKCCCNNDNTCFKNNNYGHIVNRGPQYC